MHAVRCDVWKAATAVGNLLVQARAQGSVRGDLDALRALIRTTGGTVRHEPATARP